MRRQIPPDLVVKSQLIDIVEIIYHLSGDQRAFKSYGEIGAQGVSCTPSQRPIGLPLNSMECAQNNACGTARHCH